MSASLNDVLTLARVNLREDAARVKPSDWILIAEQARQHFSKDRPREKIADVTGNGTKTYTLTGTVTGWIARFSKIRSLEYPTGQDPVATIQSDRYFVYRNATDTEQLKFRDDSPGTTETIRMIFSTRHDFDATTSTIDDDDKSMFALLAAHYAALALVADFLKPNRSNLPNDSVDFSQKAKDMTDLAKELLDKYAKLVTGKTPEVKTYTTLVKDFDMLGSTGDPFLIHPESNR